MAEKEKATAPGRKRLAIVISVLAYILAGLPFWWKLTEVYRVPLPYREVGRFVSKLSSSSFSPGRSLPCQLQIVFLSKEDLRDREGDWSHRLEVVLEATQEKAGSGSAACDLDVLVALDAEGLCLHTQGHDGQPFWGCGRFSSRIMPDSDTDEILAEFIGADSAGKYTILVFLDGELPNDGDGVQARFGKYRHAWVNCPLCNEQQLIRVVTETATALLTGGGSSGTGMPLAADGSAVLSFSLLNADPESWTFDWDFDSVEPQYLAPVIDALAPVARVSVESQVLYYTPAAAKPRWNAALRAHVIDSKDLSFFVNANEWHLDTSTGAAGRSKILHFAIYIPSVRECPLRIKLPSGRVTSSSDGFTIPGWGGVVIWNPPGCLVADNSTLSVIDLQPTMEVVVAQLRTLFGLPRTKCSEASVPDAKTGFAMWELDRLLRRRVIADVNSTASTLTSLLKLVESLPKMVIQEEIGVRVRTSLAAAEKAIDLRNASYKAIGDLSASAKAWAETAFFHPSIMSLLHFPKEHQFAIYTPFFVPVVLHTVVSVVKETTRYVRERRRCKQ